MKKEEHEQTINIEHCKNELCINFRRKVWWTSKKNNQSIVNMNSKLLYSHSRHEGKHNGDIKLKKHSHKKGSYKLQHDITHEYLKDANFQLCNLKKYLNTQIYKISWVPTIPSSNVSKFIQLLLEMNNEPNFLTVSTVYYMCQNNYVLQNSCEITKLIN